MGIKEFEDYLNQDEKSWVENNLSEIQEFHLQEKDRYKARMRFEKLSKNISCKEFDKFHLDEKAWMENNLSKGQIKRYQYEDLNDISRYFKKLSFQ